MSRDEKVRQILEDKDYAKFRDYAVTRSKYEGTAATISDFDNLCASFPEVVEVELKEFKQKLEFDRRRKSFSIDL